MANSARYNHHYREMDLVRFTHDELVERYLKGQPLTTKDYRDAERIVKSRAARKEAAE
jgi:hypothetical protein